MTPLPFYCLSFGALLGSVLLGAYGVFCRTRTCTAGIITPRECLESNPLLPSRKEDRISVAMRSWTADRADADLEIAPVPAIEPSPAIEPPPTIEPSPASDLPIVLPNPIPAFVIQQSPQPVEFESGICGHTTPPPAMFAQTDFEGAPNYYDVLQISPRADLDTIHRVYRIMAARFHPDNPQSGDHERFLELGKAYEVLSDAARRTQYDTALRLSETQPLPIFALRVFVDGLEGEINRRLGILSLLYQRRRNNGERPGIAVLDLEARMSLPREHLEFTLWYLRSKLLVQIMEENSDYALTAAGVDFVESHSSTNRIVRELLAPSSTPVHVPPPPGNYEREKRRARNKAAAERRH